MSRVFSCIAGTLMFVSGCADMDAQSEARSTTTLTSPSMWVGDGVFAEAQSRRGEMQYLTNCKDCHQRDLSGDLIIEDAPALVGDDFLSEWDRWTVGDLFDFMQTEMPPKRKDRRKMTPENYADILAFILEKNGFPAGSAELPPEFEPLSQIEMSRGK